ncbi:HAMP domain-containing sensor histidine kinase [Segetibacter koreensis]|uniref:HAMP domain-containing sensor histidine kinase n=1 Tax=Segetibacter koreensis TaxID=398037 RepID=UPI00039D52CF|nr:HAMP domain-containing sensor histidine kinase [Segetibacter koreensis]
MNLKVRIALLFTLSVFIILLVSAVSVYLLNEKFRKEEFIKRLTTEAKESGQIFFSESKPSPGDSLRLLQNAVNSLPQENLFIYDSAFHLLYSTPGSHIPKISAETFNKARQDKQFSYTDKEREVVLLSIEGNHYYAVASALDVFGNRKSDNLKALLILSILGGILLSGLLAFFLVKQAIRPLEKLKLQIETINEQNLKERIFIGRSNDEVSQIAKKFNAMLDRLELAFEQQKSFVHHASHELRTPLATMLAQTEAALNKILYIEDYRRILYSLREEQQYLIDLTNSLLTLSRYEKMTSQKDWLPVRIDEILFEMADLVKQEWLYATINIDFDTVFDNENHLTVIGNESLIKSAIMNLIKNAIQYSKDQGVKITIDGANTGIILHFDNIGKRLSPEEQANLFIPFFRGENSKYKKGYGLGLSIVKKIVNVHGGTISYHSLATDINRFSIFLPAQTA